MPRILIVAALFALSAAAGFGVYQWSTRPDAPSLPRPAPDLTLPALDGGSRALSEWRGTLLLVNFWATWCPPCLYEIPMLVELQNQFGARGLQIIGPALDDPEAVKLYLPRLAINYPVMAGDAPVASAMDALGDTLGALPYSVLIDAEGRIVATRHGEFEREELIELIERHLPQGP